MWNNAKLRVNLYKKLIGTELVGMVNSLQILELPFDLQKFANTLESKPSHQLTPRPNSFNLKDGKLQKVPKRLH